MEYDENCLFCQISRGKVGKLVYEDPNYAVFDDIHPKAKIHMLLVPKTHIPSLNEVGDDDKDLLGGLLTLAKNLANKYKLDNGYRVIINTGKNAGQTVNHLHLHLLGGEMLSE